MKFLKAIGISILAIIIFFANPCYGQTDDYEEQRRSLIKKGVEYGARGKFKEAREEFEKGLENSRKGSFSFYFTFTTPLNLRLIEHVDQQKINPGLVTYYFETIHKFELPSPQWEKAIEYFNRIVEQNPEDPWVYLLRGEIYGSYGRREPEGEKAISDYSKAIELNPENPDFYLLRGDAYHYKNKYDTAVSDFSRAIEINPEFVDAYFKRGGVYSRKGRYDNAISDYSKVIELNPENPAIYLVRGITYRWKKEYDNAISDFSRAIELKPDYYDAYYLRQSVYEDKGRYADALSDFSRLQEISPVSPGSEIHIYSHETTKNMFESLKKHIESPPLYDFFIDIWENTKGIALKNAGEYFARGYIAFHLEYYAAAIPDFSKAIELNPESCVYYEYRGSAHAEINKYEEAVIDYNKAIKLKPDEPIYYFGRAKAFFCKEQFDNAVNDFSKAIELKAPYPIIAYELRGDAYVNLGKYQEAITDYSKIIESNPALHDWEIAQIFNKRGDACDKTGNRENACADWKKAFELGDKSRWSILNRIRCLGK